MGRYILLENLFHGSTCLTEEHVLLENIVWRTCLMGGYVLIEICNFNLILSDLNTNFDWCKTQCCDNFLSNCLP